jgi:hypothetical protein
MRKTKETKKPAAKGNRQPGAGKSSGAGVAAAPSAVAFGVYAIPQTFYGALQLTPMSAALPINATIASYESTDSAPITLQMTSTWIGDSGQDPRKPQRLIVFDGIVDTQLPAILWQDQGIPFGKDGQWPARLLASKTGYLTVLPLHMEGGPLWTQNTNAGNPYIGAYGNSATTVYEDQADGPGSNRPDIVATISAPNVLFSRLSPRELAVLLNKRR